MYKCPHNIFVKINQISPNLCQITSPSATDPKQRGNIQTHLSGIIAGASKLHMYRSMHTQLDTTRIHIATSERPMYTFESGSGAPEIGFLETMFL